MTAVADARTRLYDAVALAAPAPWRAHRVTPSQIAAPCVYLDAVELSTDTSAGVPVIVCTFPVVCVHDGAVRAQVEALDDLLAAVWTAATTVDAEPQSSRPIALDVGGPTLRAHVLRVDVPVLAITFCPPSLVAVGGTP